MTVIASNCYIYMYSVYIKYGIMVWICAVGLSSIYIYCTMNALRLHERYVCTCPRVYILYLSASRAFRSKWMCD